MFDSPGEDVSGVDSWCDGEVHFVGQLLVVATPNDQSVTVFEDSANPEPLHRSHVAFADREFVGAQVDGGARGMVAERCLRVVLLRSNLAIVVSPHRQRVRVDIGDMTVESSGYAQQNRCNIRAQVNATARARDNEPFDVDGCFVGADRPAID